MKKDIVIKKNEDGMRLDLVISLFDNTISRSMGRLLLNDGKVFVNEKIEYRPNYKVREGDRIFFESVNNINKQSVIVPQKMDLDIVYEDSNLLVLNKPSGLVTHPANGHYDDTLMNGVLYHYNNMAEVGDGIRSGLIHRLDRDTSGLILIGKTNKGLWHYSKMFAERKVKKVYLAIVKGDFRSQLNENGFLDVRTGYDRSRFDRKKFTSKNLLRMKRIAETRFELLKYDEKSNFSIVICKPMTGRTHQIRVHLSDLGFPIIGDNLYGNFKYARLMLHAWKLAIIDPSGQLKEFIAPIPKEFQDILNEG